MLTGDVPFLADTPVAIVIKHITAPMPIPRSINPKIPEALERIILKSTAKDADDWRVVRFYFRNGGAAADIATSIGGSNLVTGVMAFDTWAHCKLSFNHETEKFTLEIDGNPVYTDMNFNEVGYGHDYSEAATVRLDWEYAAGADVMFDNLILESWLSCAELWSLEQGISADVSHDCYVDLLDFLVVSSEWLTCNDPMGCDP